MGKPLLSIIIPTKNRQHTCLYAVKSALTIAAPDVEIIVQDCSDINVLQAQLDQLQDARIHYQHDNTGNVSMTDNWNRAIQRAQGLYLCGIGDDDAILPDIYDIAKWALQQQFEAVTHTNPYNYYWPDFSIDYQRGRLFLEHEFDGTYTVDRNTTQTCIEKSKPLNMGFMDGSLPLFYHSLIHKDLLQRHYEQTDKYLDGTSLDVYSAFALGFLCQSLCTLNFPFTVRGACGRSNSNRVFTRKFFRHFKEYDQQALNEPRVPFMINLEATIAESMIKAFRNLDHPALIENIDYVHLYASYIMTDKWNYLPFVRHYRQHCQPINSVWALHQRLGQLIWKAMSRRFGQLQHTLTTKLRLSSTLAEKPSFQYVNTLDVVDFHRKHTHARNMRINELVMIAP